MAATTSSLATIQEFLAYKRFAMIGLSRDPKHFSTMLFRAFCARGYDVVPVNPNATEIEGRRCFAHVGEIEAPVDAALLMTSREASDSVIEECAKTGIRMVWLYGAGAGPASFASALGRCEKHGMAVVAGECPFMFFEDNGFHRLHGWWQRIVGKYPSTH
jgi:predicted CoA-binding protein